MKNKSNIVHDRLCADCYRKLNTPPKTREEIRHREEPAPAPKDYGFTQQTFLDLAALDKL